MATNRIDSLDPALIRPGRIDRKIEFPLPDEKTKRRIFNIHTSKMTLSTCVKVDEYILAKDDLSGADIKAICTEAGLMALRYVLHSVSYYYAVLPFYNVKCLCSRGRELGREESHSH